MSDIPANQTPKSDPCGHDGPLIRPEESSENSRMIKIMAVTGLATAFVMTGFELAKQLIHANITLWGSHLVTILFTTVLSVLLTNFALRKHHSLRKILSGYISVCTWCHHKVRDANGEWIPMESYLAKYSEAKMTHSICPECNAQRRSTAP